MQYLSISIDQQKCYSNGFDEGLFSEDMPLQNMQNKANPILPTKLRNNYVFFRHFWLQTNVTKK